jgi:outer membrane usher protein
LHSWERITAVLFGFCAAALTPFLASHAQTTGDPVKVLSGPTTLTTPSDYDPAADEALFLLVSINGRDTGLIAEFALSRATNRMSVQRSELESVGIAAPRNLGRTVFLDQIPGLAYVYQAASQTILIAVGHASLIPVEISAVPYKAQPVAQTGLGVVLNYRITANLGDNVFSDGFRPTEVFSGLDLRAYTPFGVLTTTGSVSTSLNGVRETDIIRYDTYFTVSSPSRMMTLTAGDFTTSGLAWTRPVRLGGLQIRRDFSLRDDVVTNPLLSYSGTAAVPSSIDVYVDNVRAYSGAIPPGPFNLSDVPMITSGGEAVFVLRDAGGNEQVSTVPFFATQSLLPKGMLDYSLEAGRAREDYGRGNFSYGGANAVAVSLRYGMFDRLTVEAHAEALNDLKMAGLGLAMNVFNRAEVTLAGGKSLKGAATGSFLFGTLRTEVAGIGMRFSTRRTFGDYQDLASVTTQENPGGDIWSTGILSSEVIKNMDALSLTFPLFSKDESLGISLINSERLDQTNTILSVAYSRQLPWRSASFRVNAFKDFAGDGGFGMSVGLSMPLGALSHAGTGLARDRNGDIGAVASLMRSADRQAGSYGYRINLSRHAASFGATYQTRYGRADVALRDTGQGIGASATFDGALVIAGGGLFAGDRINDGFAVVDVGVPHVPVKLNNREAAHTGMFGRALVSDLRSYRLNRISIDPLDVPIDANLAATAQDVVPARRSGVSVDFGGGTDSAALVVLRDTAGAFVKPGSTVRRQGKPTEFIVGYDGEVWIEGLSARNRITVINGAGQCTAEFAYAEIPGEQVYIDGVECR